VKLSPDPFHDANVEAVRQRLEERAAVGLRKYGTDTARDDYDAAAWLRELQEELLDAAVYIEAALGQLAAEEPTAASGASDADAAFARAIEFTLRWETGDRADGGWTHDPKDPGGETRWGLSRRSYPDLDFATVTRDQAIEIYRRDYWEPACGWLWEGPDTADGCGALAAAIFDFAVHSGIKAAITALQGIVGVAQDGIAGPRTREAVCLISGWRDELALDLVNRRAWFLENLVCRKPDLMRFERGWRNRLDALRALIRGWESS